ncbi:MAG TPA: DUF523 and DUF1722 domain-containing protein [Deltaproteobacteria bacterium]|nr:DUF523 and DUF1722 domain-containing protein [Deltaproteobacteria bacterium]HQB39061.1 DUF523 and DUF1722 domain-containing protein [Deltaproteobacteria bacterium]
MQSPPTLPIRIAVSSCLLGEPVRYDGGHKLDRYITDTLGNYFQFVPICPEIGCGLPVPREAMRLEGDPAAPRLMTNRTRVDLTGQMLAFCHSRTAAMETEDLCGYIFKSKSPSSGLYRVKVYNSGMPAKTGRGLFAAAVTERFPLLPMEEEGRLHDADIRENFLERVFSYRRWKDFLAGRPDLGALVEFHTRQKLLVMSHSIEAYRELGRLVAHGREQEQEELLRQYEQHFMSALALHATVKKQTNVLMHIMGYFKIQLDSSEKAELLEVIGQYHDRLVPLVVPLTLVRHYVRKYAQPYLQNQVYLSPHPAELMLRNHV